MMTTEASRHFREHFFALRDTFIQMETVVTTNYRCIICGKCSYKWKKILNELDWQHIQAKCFPSQNKCQHKVLAFDPRGKIESLAVSPCQDIKPARGQAQMV